MIDLEKSINSQKQLTPSFAGTDEFANFTKLSASEVSQLKVGDFIHHQKFGTARIAKIEGTSHNPIATVPFAGGEKKLMLNYANLIKQNV